MTSMSMRILIGLVVGLAAGAAARLAPPDALALALAIATPIGALWLDALTMTVLPLVFGLLVTGVGSAASSAGASGVAARAMAGFAIGLIGACALAALLTLQILAWWPPPAGAQAFSGAPPPLAQAGAWFEGLIPANPVKAAAEMSIAPLAVFALFFGFAASRIETPLRASLMTFFAAVVATMLVIVRWVLLAAPVGVMALAFAVGAKSGAGAAGALVHYVLVVVAACLAITAAAYVLATVFGRLSPIAFAKAALPVQVVALGSQSSLACLPAMMTATSALRTRPGSAEVVLPLSVAVFRAASAAANIAVALYLAKVHGVALTPGLVLIAVLVAAAVSLAAVGLPAQVSFFATIGPVCLVLGAPLEALPVLLAIETLPDLFRTAGNVTCDLALARIVGRPERDAPDRPEASP